MLSAFRILNATRNKKMSCRRFALWARSNARLRRLLGSSKIMDESLPTFVEDSEVGVEDIASVSRKELHVSLVSTPKSRIGPRAGSEVGQPGFAGKPRLKVR